MKRRVRKIANFFAFNLLFFALYLNFIHKDKVVVSADNGTQQSAAAFSGTVLVENPTEYMNNAKATPAATVQATQAVEKTEANNSALKLSIN
ncbi:MAG TPA: hypothetical protein VHM26_05025 [Chitinophagaceae bacterium]|jgi:hypothetical protein|nr:hypothetical protein [Chitinophagaceae bacterium]